MMKSKVVAASLGVLSALGVAASTIPLAAAAQSRQSTPFVAEVSVEGPIGPAAAEYFENATSRAAKAGADAIILRLDTPGGLSQSMRSIVSTILASKLPVLCYVSPDGARAASAGTYIMYACQVSAMAPATHLGAATPVSLSGGTRMPAQRPANAAAQPAGSQSAGDAESNKVLNDAVAYIRSLAQLRGRNAEWAEQAVRGAATITASEAVKSGVVDFVASDAGDLLQQASGRQVRVGERSVVLALANQPVRAYAPNWRTGFLSIVTTPTIAYVLLLAGLFGLIIEAFHPGFWFPGIAGAISLLTGMYALQMLPVNYAGLALMTLGVGLLIAELVSPSLGVMGVGGVIAFVLGSVMLMNTNVPGYTVNLGVIAGIAFAAIAVIATIVWLVMRARRSAALGLSEMVGNTGQMLDATNPAGEGWAQVNGERWKVLAATPIPANTNVRVVRRDGLVLWVIPE
jgi:membrane-bound serine protease (ClpP class)